LLDGILNKSSNSINDDDDSEIKFNLLAITLDLDDGSLKQPVGSDDTSLFPKDDKDAISTWPYLIYVEGGNTFWLQHCIEKGDYSTLLKNACIGSSGAVYMGKSAGGKLYVLELGKKCLLSYHMLIILSPHIICSNSCTSKAIVAGSNISTATWKGWDDPASKFLYFICHYSVTLYPYTNNRFHLLSRASSSGSWKRII